MNFTDSEISTILEALELSAQATEKRMEDSSFESSRKMLCNRAREKRELATRIYLMNNGKKLKV